MRMNFIEFAFVLCCCLLCLRIATSRYSYLSTGRWADIPDNVPCDHYMCSHNNLTWKADNPKFRYYFHHDACNALLNKGIKKIFFHGDSYMRQIYSAMLITLSGDYRYGSISNSTLFPRCEYHRQFSEKHCGLKELNHHGLTCGGKILLDPALNGLNDLNHCEPGTALLWSFGNHRLSRYGRYGVNNATAYQLSFEQVCSRIKHSDKVNGHVNKQCSVWWVSTHSRIRTIFDDECPECVFDFNEGMRSFYERGSCGETNYIDVYNMTNRLVVDYSEVGRTMSYDLVHWGMEVNLIKAQIIINALLDSP